MVPFSTPASLSGLEIDSVPQMEPIGNRTTNSQCPSLQNYRDFSSLGSIKADTNRLFHSNENESIAVPFNCSTDIPEAQNINSSCMSNFTDHHNSPVSGPIHASLSEEIWFKEKVLNIMHLNIHYLHSKLDELKILLTQQNNIDILCVCETFLHDE